MSVADPFNAESHFTEGTKNNHNSYEYDAICCGVADCEVGAIYGRTRVQ
jgi:hypothetical protein